MQGLQPQLLGLDLEVLENLVLPCLAQTLW